ncbi:MAG: class I SAM-dependent methyltransferase [Trebonia sp.]
MRSTPNPFTDAAQVWGPLYATASRIASRTSALHRARVVGRHAAEVITELAAEADPEPAIIADIGCGRGTTTLTLAKRFPNARITAIDLSAPLLAVTRDRLFGSPASAAIRADFHQIPLADESCALVVAAFCLYHSPTPADAVAEIARCLTRDGKAILVVKSADSYRELDCLMAASGLDPSAESRPSLYQAAHSGNITDLAATGLSVRQVVHETHRFIFPSLADAAGYLATSPKYDLPPALAGSPDSLAAALRERLPDGPVQATSVVTYLVSDPKAGASR